MPLNAPYRLLTVLMAAIGFSVLTLSLTFFYESHHFYPVLHHFRFQENVYALARIALLALDTGTLIRSALDERAYPSLVRSTSVAALWGGGMQLLEGVAATFLPQPQPDRAEELEGDTERAWRAHFERAAGKLRAEGIVVIADVAAGADKYVALRREWGRTSSPSPSTCSTTGMRPRAGDRSAARDPERAVRPPYRDGFRTSSKRLRACARLHGYATMPPYTTIPPLAARAVRDTPPPLEIVIAMFIRGLYSFGSAGCPRA